MGLEHKRLPYQLAGRRDPRRLPVGAGITAADLTLYPFLAFGSRIEKRFPEIKLAQLIGAKILAWKARLDAQPWFSRVWPAHRK